MWSRLTFWIGAASVVGGVALAQSVSPGSPSAGRSVDVLPKGRWLPPAIGEPMRAPAVAISPDGRTIVYRAEEDGRSRLYRRAATQANATPIGEPGAAGVFFSPDGRSIGFTVPSATAGFGVGATLKRMPVDGGPAQTIAAGIASTSGAHWNEDGTILIGGAAATGLRRVSTAGEVTVLAPPAPNTSFRFPQMLPGGKTVLYTGGTGMNGQLMILDVTSGTSRSLMPGLGGRYLPTGHLVFAARKDSAGDDYSLWAVGFDPTRGETRGSPVAVVDGIRVDVSGLVQAAISDAGVLAYLPGAVTARRTMAWIDRAGREQPIDLEPRTYATPRVSPDGRQLVFTVRDTGLDVYAIDLGTRQTKQLTIDAEPNYLPVWFPDSKRVAFSSIGPSAPAGAGQVTWRTADASGVVERFGDEHPNGNYPQAFLSDGRLLVAIGTVDIGLLAANGKGPREMLLNAPEVERNAVVSPDNRWLAFESNRSGRTEIYVRPFPNVKEREFQVTKTGACCAVWARDGRLYYWTEGDGMVAVRSVTTTTSGTAFSPGSPATAARGHFAKASWDTPYDVAPDGRIVVTKSVLPPPPNQIVVVPNWIEELKRLVRGT